MRQITKRLMSLAAAVLAVTVLIFAAPKPAEAAPLTTGIATSVNAAKANPTEQVYYRRVYYRRYYRRPVFYRRPVYYRPVYYGRRCWTRPQMVATPWGWRRRLVRVCR